MTGDDTSVRRPGAWRSPSAWGAIVGLCALLAGGCEEDEIPPTTPGNPTTPSAPSGRQPPDGKLPRVAGACPDFRDGAMATVGGLQVKFYAGAAGRRGPLVFYFHGTGGSADEVDALFGFGTGGLGSDVIREITAQGGIVASLDTSTGGGNPIEYGVWATDDFNAVDQIVACAIQAGRIDPGRIHALGFSAGGLAVGALYYLRSNYLASVATYSGGTSPWPGNDFPQDSSNRVAAMLFHGGSGDWVILSFEEQSIMMADEATSRGAFVVMCDHQGGHGIPSEGPRAAWEFFKAHPYGTSPSPWASGLPSSIPRYCRPY